MHGLYPFTYDLAIRAIDEAEVQSDRDRILLVKLAVLAADMAYHRGEGSGWVERLQSVQRILDVVDGHGIDDVRVALKVAMSRLLRRRGDIETEAALLEEFPPQGDYLGDYAFRLASLSWYSRGAYDWALERLGRIEVDPIREPMAAINIRADVARLRLHAGEVEDAYRELAEVFVSARRLFFRRNLHATGLSLAEVALQLGEPGWAAEWWRAAAQFAAVGAGHDVSVEEVRGDIIAAGGERCLCARSSNVDALLGIANAFGEVAPFVAGPAKDQVG